MRFPRRANGTEFDFIPARMKMAVFLSLLHVEGLGGLLGSESPARTLWVK